MIYQTFLVVFQCFLIFFKTSYLLCKWLDFCCIILFFRSETMIQDAFNFDFDSQIPVNKAPAISIGYYNLRGKAQVPRLLCQYLNVDYKDQLFSLAEWDRYKKSKAKSWDFPDVPFLKQGDFVVTQPIPICIYLIKRFGSQDLLGKTLEDRTIVSMYVWTIDTMGNIININCQKMTPLQLVALKKAQWKNNVAPRLTKYEEIAQQDNWFLGYFTIIDLSMYELVRYMELIFPGALGNFPKLKAIEKRVGQLPAIKKYQASDLSIKQTDPTKLLEELKRSKIIAQSQYSKN